MANDALAVAEFDQSSIGTALGSIAATLVSVWGGWRMLKGQARADAVANADAGGTIGAIDTYKELVATLIKAKDEAEERADRFATERNEALQGMYELKGQLRTLTEQLATQNLQLERQNLQLVAQAQELTLLRDEVSKLRGRRQDDKSIQ